MHYSILTVILLYILISPVLIGYMHGLPTELELIRLRISGTTRRVLWLAAYLCAPVVYRLLIINDPFGFWHLNGYGHPANLNLLAWLIIISLLAVLIYAVFNMLVAPVLALPLLTLSWLKRFATRLSSGWGSFFAAILEVPRGFLHFIIAAGIIHLAISYLALPSLAALARHSEVYQWANSNLIVPLFSQPLTNAPFGIGGKLV